MAAGGVSCDGASDIQGYIELKQRRTVTQMKNWLSTAHFGARIGTRVQARDYTRKEESRVDGPWERGQWQAAGQGRRTDLEDAIETLKNATHTKALKRVAEKNPAAFVKFSRGLHDLADELEVLPADRDFVPRPWHGDLLQKLAIVPDDRKIFWVTDTEGGKGKSRLARYLVLEKDAIQLSGKVTDMQFAYSEKKAKIWSFSASVSCIIFCFLERIWHTLLTATALPVVCTVLELQWRHLPGLPQVPQVMCTGRSEQIIPKGAVPVTTRPAPCFKSVVS